jgi:type I restriction enzyme S subunit
MKKGWELKPFESCIVPVEYTRKIQRKDFLDEGLFPIVSQEAAFTNGYWNDQEDVFKVSTPVVIFGDHTQVLKYVDFDFVLGADGVKILQPREFLQPKFFYYILQATEKPSLGYSRHYRLLKELEIPIPPLPEQQRIVGVLDEAFASLAIAQANTEKNRQNARALFESHLQSVFTQRGEGWVETTLPALCDPLRIITYGVIKLGDETPSGIPCLRTSNVRWLRINTEGMKRIAPSLSAEYSRTILQGGEVLVNVRGTLGGVAVVEPEMAGWNVSREVAVVPVDHQRINPSFLAYLIGSGVSQQWLGGVKKGAAYTGINIEDLRLLPIAVPKHSEQKRIVAELDALASETQRLEGIYQRKLEALAALKKSLLQQAFSGQL